MKVLVSGDRVPERLARYCREHGHELDHLAGAVTEEELRARVADVEHYLLAGDEHLTAPVLRAARVLRCVSFAGVGAGSFVDLDAARRGSVTVLNTPGVNAAAVAEFAVGLALGVARRLFPDLLGTGERVRTSAELTGSTVGVLGLGASGTALARVLRLGFGCRVLYSSRTRKPDVERELGVVPVDPAGLFAECTTVFVCCALTEETTGLVDDELLRPGPSPRFLVSTADPRVLDPAALRRALDGGALTAVAMDGYFREPLPAPDADEHDLLRRPVFVTSHIAASSAGTWQRMEDRAVDNLIDAIERERG
ncbi:D-isomer specific 2-hydroxyacid dehydrogenase family protein [Actinosynnema sp. NPDC053489]|uniref:D-isomer specific 2-hydroxyacid dehydrogenase family protein n=1 Tax=Actinosynnema sp. NPDC053489 TaxID=3363916 RepID=UPI0037C99949